MDAELEKKYLEEWRNSKYWSQARLSREAGVNQSVISRVEKGEIIGRFETMLKIANALGIKPEQILEFAPRFEVKKSDRQPGLINQLAAITVPAKEAQSLTGATQ